MYKKITNLQILEFAEQLRVGEKSDNTIQKYLRDVRNFQKYVNEREVTKEVVMEYKSSLMERYEVSSINSILAAVNSFLKFWGLESHCVKQFRVQKKAFCSEEKELTKEEYIRLVNAAKQKGNERLYLVIQTICGTGIRVSELPFITVQAVKRGEAVVSCKNKTRTIFIVQALQKKLLKYIKEKGITDGPVFVTKNGKPMSRTNIWREMKGLCEQAGVSAQKVFPHNLRHLFARAFYGMDKDIAKLADILGHSSINTTRIYIITTGAEHKRKLEHMRLII